MGQGYTAGKRWDVRWARIRSVDREREKTEKLTQNAGAAEADNPAFSTNGESEVEPSNKYIESESGESLTSEPKAEGNGDPGLTIVCRPKVGEMVVGGGFLGIWKRTRTDSGQ